MSIHSVALPKTSFLPFAMSSMDELTSASGGGPLPVVMALMLSSPAGLELTTLQDLMQLAGNLVSGNINE